MESKYKTILVKIFFIIVLAAGITIPSSIYLNQISTYSINNEKSISDPIKASDYSPTGIYDLTPAIYYQCGCIPPCIVNLDYTQFTFVDDGSILTIQPAMNGGCFMTGYSALDGVIDVSCTYYGSCNEHYTLLGTFTDNNTWEGTFTVSFTGGSCMDCTTHVWSITGKRIDTEDPIITNSPNNLTVELGYSGESISWTATDIYPFNYTIKLYSSGIVAGPTAWSSGTAVTYNIPDGLTIGEYYYTVNFTDESNHYTTDTVKMTVIEDTSDPIITNTPSNLTIGFGYTGVSISWTATDTNPNIYTVKLQSSGIVAGPAGWSSGIEITYNITDGLTTGEYFYTVNFTDDYGHFEIDTVKITVVEGDAPRIIVSSNSFAVDQHYTGINITWTATDANPDVYTIELQGSGIVAGPSSWSSGMAIVYNIPDGLAVGEYVYTINITDDYDNFVTDTVTMTVEAPTPNGDGDEVPRTLIPGYNTIISLCCIAVISLILFKKLKQKKST